MQLWKKSGAWLSNKLPVINLSDEELEKAQQLRQRQNMVRKDTPLSPSIIILYRLVKVNFLMVSLVSDYCIWDGQGPPHYMYWAMIGRILHIVEGFSEEGK